MLINRYIFYYFLSTWVIVSLVFLPLLFLSDFLFHDKFSSFIALKKITIRYGQSFAVIVFWSIWVAIKRLRNRYKDTAFFASGFRPKDAWKVLLFFAMFFIFLEYCVIIPSNDYFFKPKVDITSWILVNNKNDSMLINKIDSKNGDVWVKFDKKKNLRYCHASFDNDVLKIDQCDFVDHTINGWQKEKFNFEKKIKEKDFYIIWSESRKLSWLGLKEANDYWNYHDIVFSAVKIQWHAFVSRAFLLVGLMLLGYFLGWQSSIFKMILVSIISSWLGQISIFLDASIAVVIIWINVLLWLVLGVISLW
jgi:hypothetical protein